MNPALFSTLVLGLCIVLGIIAVFISKNNEKIKLFTIGTAFSVIVLLAVLEIIPEAYSIASEHFGVFGSVMHTAVCAAAGTAVLKLLDVFMPGHAHGDSENYAHIGIMSSVAIIIHNIVEGASVYAVFSSSRYLGIMLCVSIGLHNIPMGMMIASSLYSERNKKAKLIPMFFALSFSTFLGGLAVSLSSISFSETLLAGTLLSVSAGMLAYIALFELLHEIHAHIKNRQTVCGLAAGIILFLCGIFIFG